VLWSWLNRHPVLVDLLAVGLVGLSSVGGAVSRNDRLWVSVPIAVASSLALIARRQRPVEVAGVITALMIVGFAADTMPFPLPLAAALFTVASHCPRRVAVRAGVASIALAVGGYLLAGNSAASGISGMLAFVAAWFIGDSVRSRRAYVAAVEERAERAEREREAQALRAVAEEQARIARELHDVVAHSVSVIAVQAAAADDVFDTHPERAREALRSIDGAARAALGDLRRVLGALTDEADYAPQPGLDQLPRLVADVRNTGLEVSLTVEGAPRPLPAAVDLSAYRIVQEALTNTIRHAAARRAEVRVGWGSELALEVHDDGRGVGDDASRGSGRGLVGMRQRAALVAGEVTAGPAFGGGYTVRARIPLA
jgi:signal transduction histidine kinase